LPGDPADTGAYVNLARHALETACGDDAPDVSLTLVIFCGEPGPSLVDVAAEPGDLLGGTACNRTPRLPSPTAVWWSDFFSKILG
jgi:hypothetical protein